MADLFIEKKVHFLGHWKNSRVDNETILQINSQIAKAKGNRVKLLLSSDGIRVVKSSVIQGKMLHEYIPLARIQFMTVSQNLPNLLMVISLSNGVVNVPYEIHAFRCDNGMDAGMYMEAFRSMQKTHRSATVVKTAVPQKTENDEINWTLRSKEHDNSKRDLKQFVEFHGEKLVGQRAGEGGTLYIENEKPVLTNGNTQVFENGVRIPLYRKGKPTRLERESFETDVSDSRSEVSESALRNELETLSQELRDIKIMLEHSTGITAGSEPGSPRDFQAVNVHTHTVQPEHTVIQRAVLNGEQKMEAVVLDDEPVRVMHKENGYNVTRNGPVTHVRLDVPDYRNYSEGTSSYTVTTEKKDYQTVIEGPSSSTIIRTPAPVNTDFEIVKPRSRTTSYENWKKNTMERKVAVRHSELPERIQWKSRSSRASHVVTTRPRSAIPVWSTDAVDSSMVEVRHHPAGMGPAYQRVSFNPRAVKMREIKTQSLRARGLSTTVAKPIDRVYIGRADAKHHHSLSYRPQTANFRPSILLRDTDVVVPQNHVQTVVAEQNNNVVKQENDDQLLDVSGVDLYNETPSVVGAVIRT